MLRKFLAVVLMLGAVGVQQASASQLYATTVVDRTADPSDLYQVDKFTGASTLVGSVGYIVTGMDYYNGVLYGVTSFRDPNHHGLIKIDTVTGAGTPIGTGWGASLPDLTISELAIDSLGNAFGWSEATTDDLASLDLGTGLVNGIVGDAGFGTASLSLAFDLDNTLYLMNGDAGTYEIDASTGAASFVGFLDRLLHHGDVDPDTGLFYGLATLNSEPTEIDVVDLSDLETLGTLVVDEVRFHTLAFVPTNVVPEPSTLAGMAAGAAIALVAARRRRTA